MKFNPGGKKKTKQTTRFVYRGEILFAVICVAHFTQRWRLLGGIWEEGRRLLI